MEIKIFGVQLSKRSDRGDPISASSTDRSFRPLSWKVLPELVIQSGMRTVLGLLKSGKLRFRWTIDPGDPMNFLENGTKSSFRHEEILFDGTAQSVVNEAMPHDRTGETRYQLGHGSTILHWKRWNEALELSVWEWSSAEKIETNFQC